MCAARSDATGQRQTLTVLLLPGMDGTGELLAALVGRLSLYRPVQVIAYPAKPLGYDDLVDFVVSRAPKERFVIVGESFSGPIAIEIAASLSRTAGLVLASSFVRRPMPSFLASLARIIDPAWVPRSIAVAMLLGSTATPELKARLIQVLGRLPRELMRLRIREVLRADKRDRLREVRCPMLCLQGRMDRLVRKQSVDDILSAKPECQIRWFDAPHMLLETHPDAAADVINQFCLRLS
jgi:pimeloyl-[acyl-carrier protein] methyl ester esterase